MRIKGQEGREKVKVRRFNGTKKNCDEVRHWGEKLIKKRERREGEMRN